MNKVYNVLFLCTGNSARSIFAEAILNKEGAGRFRAYSVGSFPKGQVHPAALKLLGELGYSTDDHRSKSWAEFADEGAPPLDFIFTVCDRARGEACPVWPGQPMTAHWGSADPALAEGSEEERLRIFRHVYSELENRIKSFVSLRIESLDRLVLKRKLEEIGKGDPS